MYILYGTIFFLSVLFFSFLCMFVYYTICKRANRCVKEVQNLCNRLGQHYRPPIDSRINCISREFFLQDKKRRQRRRTLFFLVRLISKQRYAGMEQIWQIYGNTAILSLPLLFFLLFVYQCTVAVCTSFFSLPLSVCWLGTCQYIVVVV